MAKQSHMSRRTLLQRSGQLAVVGAASSYTLGLAGIGEAAAFSTSKDYKALVCIFLRGGNDHANTLVPYDHENHARYAAIRGQMSSGGVGLSQTDLAKTVLIQPEGQFLTDNIRYALAPTMPRMKARFDEGVLAPLLNVGPLEAPLTLAQFRSENRTSFPIPDHLFSHNDQEATWQSSKPEGQAAGWGGRIADLAQSQNSNAMFTAISASGNGVFLRGTHASAYRISPRGSPRFSGLRYGQLYGSTKASEALEKQLRTFDNHILKRDYAQINARSIEYGSFINDTLSNIALRTHFDDVSELSAQLQIVAKLIAARDRVGVRRQVFFVSMDGFDSHGKLDVHQRLLGIVDSALNSFYEATLELGVADKVTAFTASDFGRTLSLNGTGSDHGWGGHHFILGGAVNGGRFYGRAPHVSVKTDDQVGRGRLLPTTSVDEYSATLASWFGVDDDNLRLIAPNLGRFHNRDIGFMNH